MLAAVSSGSAASASTVRAVRCTPANSPPRRTNSLSPGDQVGLTRGSARSSYFATRSAAKKGGQTRPNASQPLRMKDVNTSIRRGGFDNTVWEILTDDDELVLESTIVNTANSKAAKRDAKIGAKQTKSRATKGQSKIQGAKVIKAKSKATVERTDRSESRAAAKKLDQDAPLGLETVVPRRRDWTPVKSRSTSFVNIDDLVETSRNGNAEDSEEQDDSQTKNLRGALGGFQFETSSSAVAVKQQRIGGVQPPLKRRKLDLIDAKVPAKTFATVVKKTKAPKKKARTITDQATREFMQVDDVLSTSTSLLESFFTHAPDSQPADPETESAPSADASNAGLKRSKPTKSKATTRQLSATLLSPERAIRAAEGQDLLFGTSSQLVREDSPTLIRDLQNALKESESSVNQQRCEVGVPQPGKCLWGAATRNTDGTLMAAETIDLTRTPQAIAVRAISGGPFQATTPLLAPPKIARVEQPVDLADDGAIMDTKSAKIPHLDEDSRISLPRSIAEAACKSRPRNKSPSKKAKPLTSEEPKPLSKSSKVAGTKSKVEDKSDFNTWTVAELTKQIKNYGFKPVKGKAAMVALLQKCAESMNDRQALKEMQPAENVDEVHSPHFAPVDQVLVDDVVTSKAKAKSKAKLKPKTKPKEREVLPSDATELQLAVPDVPLPTSPVQLAGAKSTKKRTAAAASTTATEETEMLDAITRAVTTFPPTHDMKNLTWHEKILLYDPIVLEDLTTWLNTVGLGRVDVDEEVWPGLVRTWCEKYSVCCVWKENLRGGKRARY